jgi:PAS domain S-box-containing protein
MATRFLPARSVLVVASACAALSVIGFFFTPSPTPAAITNLFIGLSAIVLTTLLGIRSQSAEASLREKANFLELTHDAIFSRDMDNKITFWNRGAEAMYGFNREDVVGKVPFELLKTIFPAPLAEINAEVLNAGRWEGELVHKARNGAEVIVASRWSLQQDTRGRPVSILEINNDITERKQARESLQQTQAALAHYNRVTLAGELAATIAHEVSQSLSGVVINGNSCLRWLAANPPNLDEATNAATRIVRDGKRAGDVVARIRALATRSVTTKKRIDINDAIRDVVGLARDEMEKNDVNLRMQLAVNLAPALGDRVQLQQVLLNLVMNAIEAMSASGKQPREMVITTQDDGSDEVRVAVKDSGPGLAPDKIDEIFAAFYTTKASGMGMGLSISRSIIQNHGGRLWAVPNDGQGATFQFTVPKYQ